MPTEFIELNTIQYYLLIMFQLTLVCFKKAQQLNMGLNCPFHNQQIL